MIVNTGVFDFEVVIKDTRTADYHKELLLEKRNNMTIVEMISYGKLSARNVAVCNI